MLAAAQYMFPPPSVVNTFPLPPMFEGRTIEQSWVSVCGTEMLVPHASLAFTIRIVPGI